MPAPAAPKAPVTFLKRAENLAIPHLLGEPARAILVEAMVKDAAKFSVAKCSESAAALAWARNFIDIGPEWESLPASMLKRLKELYDPPINVAWPTDRQIHAIRCSIRATLPPVVVLPIPQAAGAPGGVPGGSPLVALPQASAGNINTGRPLGARGGPMLPPPPPIPLPPGLGGGVIGGAPLAGSSSGAGSSAQTPISISGTLLSSAFLKAKLPRPRLRPLCLFHSWTLADKGAIAKANRSTGNSCAIGDEPEQDAEFPTWSQRIRLDYATEEEIREEYDGQNLAFIARWEPAAGSRAYASTKAFMDHQDQKLWTEAKPVLFSTTGIAGALLDELKAIVQNRMSTRADECVADLGGLGGPLAEVILDIQAQATSLPLLWAAYSARGRARFAGRSNAAFHINQLWFNLLSDFMEQHVMNEPAVRRGPADGRSRKRSRTPPDGGTSVGGGSSPGFAFRSGTAQSSLSTLLPAGSPSLYHTIQAPSPSQHGGLPPGPWFFQAPPASGAPPSASLPPPPAPPPTYAPPPPYAPPPSQSLHAAYGPPPPYVNPMSPMMAPPPPMRPRQPQSNQQGGPGGPAQGAGTKVFVGWPSSADIIGSLSTWPAGTPGRPCRGCAAALHSSWECPARYMLALGVACPGFTATGDRDPAAWVAGELTPATRQAWIDFGARFRLTVARGAPPRVPAF